MKPLAPIFYLILELLRYYNNSEMCLLFKAGNEISFIRYSVEALNRGHKSLAIAYDFPVENLPNGEP